MRVLGFVTWKSTDRHGDPIAGVEPLFEVTETKWRTINALEEFPSAGQVVWFKAREAAQNALLFFSPEENDDEKYSFKVASPEIATEVIDLRQLGSPADVRVALVAGIRRATLPPGHVFLLCATNLLVGPLRLKHIRPGFATYEAVHPEKIPLHKVESDIHPVSNGHSPRLVLIEDTLTTPIGFVDWDEDRLVLKRAIRTAVEYAKNLGHAPCFATKRLIDEAALAIASNGTTGETSLIRYRLERAKAVCDDKVALTSLASDVADILQSHPVVAASLEEVKQNTKRNVEIAVRAEIEAQLAKTREKAEADISRIRAEISELELERDKVHCEKCTASTILVDLRNEIEAVRTELTLREEEAEAELAKKFRDLAAKPMPFLAETAILRTFLAACSNKASLPEKQLTSCDMPQIAWNRGAVVRTDKQALLKALTGAFKSVGVSPANSIRIHASVMAGLLPLVTGNGGFAALVAYANAVCGSRYCTLNVSPSCARPVDLVGYVDGATCAPYHNGLFAAANAAKSLDVPSLMIFEGINRAPTEAYLLPVLQSQRIGVPITCTPTSVSPLSIPSALRFAATAVVGAATVPISPELWSFAVAVETQFAPRSPAEVPIGEIVVDSDLFLPADVPHEAVDDLIDDFPYAVEYRPSIERFASALARFENRSRIRAAIIECNILPAIATILNDQERDEALEGLLQKVARDDNDEYLKELRALEHRLRVRVA